MIFRIHGQIVSTKKDQAQLMKDVAKASALIKTMTGLGNNAAWAAVLEAMDHVRTHRNFRQRTRQAFNATLEEFKAYSRRLVYARENRLFHVDDLAPEHRKKYGDITDNQYYEFWCGTGALAYTRNRKWMTSLWNKFRLSLLAHGIKDAEATAWAMAGSSALRLAESIYKNSILASVEDYDLPEVLLEAIFSQLNIKGVADRWDAAVALLEPNKYDLDELEAKNIQMGLDQLQEEWTSIDTLTLSISETVEAYNEVFRTKGEQKKALRQIAEMRQ